MKSAISRTVEPSLARELRKFLRMLDEVFRIDIPDEHSQIDEPATEGDGRTFIIDSPKAFFSTHSAIREPG